MYTARGRYKSTQLSLYGTYDLRYCPNLQRGRRGYKVTARFFFYCSFQCLPFTSVCLLMRIVFSLCCSSSWKLLHGRSICPTHRLYRLEWNNRLTVSASCGAMSNPALLLQQYEAAGVNPGIRRAKNALIWISLMSENRWLYFTKKAEGLKTLQHGLSFENIKPMP